MATPTEIVTSWLAQLGAAGALPSDGAPGCAQLAWAASGAMSLTGEDSGPPLLAPGPVVGALELLGAVYADLTGRLGRRVELDPGLTLSARAAVRGLHRRGRTSAGGATRMLRARDGWCVVSLARPDDLAAVPAIVGGDPSGDPWRQLEAAASAVAGAEFVQRVRLLGVPAARVPARPEPRPLSLATPRWGSAPGRRLEGALVIDLSSLWAGPLCAQLLGASGARVVKVESTRRPDGGRSGDAAFYDWLHAGHESVALDFASPDGRAQLERLVRSADVVIEASRPRALAQLGLDPERLELRPGTVWVGITGYGRRHGDRVAFGDDAAAAGGLVATAGRGPVFCADAVADPLTGVVAAVGAAAVMEQGGGRLLDVGMRDVAAALAAADDPCEGRHHVRRAGARWLVSCSSQGADQEVLPPRRPEPAGVAPALGAHNLAVFSGLVGRPPVDDLALDDGQAHARGVGAAQGNV